VYVESPRSYYNSRPDVVVVERGRGYDHDRGWHRGWDRDRGDRGDWDRGHDRGWRR
jgi:hypothetical protein